MLFLWKWAFQTFGLFRLLNIWILLDFQMLGSSEFYLGFSIFKYLDSSRLPDAWIFRVLDSSVFGLSDLSIFGLFCSFLISNFFNISVYFILSFSSFLLLPNLFRSQDLPFRYFKFSARLWSARSCQFSEIIRVLLEQSSLELGEMYISNSQDLTPAILGKLILENLVYGAHLRVLY